MITLHVCTAKDCPNEGVEYRVEDAPALVECGGCGAHLTPVEEAK